MSEFRKLPGVDIILEEDAVKRLSNKYSPEIVTYVVRNAIDDVRKTIADGSKYPGNKYLINLVIKKVTNLVEGSLKSVINATGVVVHTNLGRSPIGEALVNEVVDIIKGYSNLEFDLNTGKRGHRYDHIRDLLKFVTGAEDALVVNNNAAAVIFVLNEFAKDKEVVVSRGELVEIGGSFRIPDIMKVSGCKMVEVGTTNKTKKNDYENSLTKETSLLFKAHTSNYKIKGFTEDVSVKELAQLAKSKKIPFVYDAGSGMLRDVDVEIVKAEPSIRTLINDGADIVTFSGDKLLGGPQCGIVAGKKKYISKLAKAPMMRALRVDKITIALLSSVCKRYVSESRPDLPIYNMFNMSRSELKNKSELLKSRFDEFGISSEIVDSKGQPGGGSLPDEFIDSYAIKLKIENKVAEKLYKKLMSLHKPIVGLLVKGELLFNVLTIDEKDFEYIVESVKELL